MKEKQMELKNLQQLILFDCPLQSYFEGYLETHDPFCHCETSQFFHYQSLSSEEKWAAILADIANSPTPPNLGLAINYQLENSGSMWNGLFNVKHLPSKEPRRLFHRKENPPEQEEI